MWKSHKRNTWRLFFCISRCVLWLRACSKAYWAPLFSAVDFKSDSVSFKGETQPQPFHLNPCSSGLFPGCQCRVIYLSKDEEPQTPLQKHSLWVSGDLPYAVNNSVCWQLVWQLASCVTSLVCLKFSGILPPYTEQAKGAWLKASFHLTLFADLSGGPDVPLGPLQLEVFPLLAVFIGIHLVP